MPSVPPFNTTGEWTESAFNHDPINLPVGWSDSVFEHPFHPVHMSVIPVQTQGVDHRGHVMVFDEGPAGAPGSRWAIVDPDPNNPAFWNFILPVPQTPGYPTRVNTNKTTPGTNPPHPDDGDIFCSGHAWTQDGKLFVAGGTVWDPPNATFWASRLAYLWDPTQWNATGGGWSKLAVPLDQGRYYPSVNRFGDNRFMVSGGFDLDLGRFFAGASQVKSTYEVFNAINGQWDSVAGAPAATDQVYDGIEEPTASEFNFYPRFHLLADPTGGTNGWFFYAGFGMDTGRNIHNPLQTQQTWDTTVGQDPVYGFANYLSYNSTVLRPINLNAANTGEDMVMRIGGGLGPYTFIPSTGSAIPRKDVEVCDATVSGVGGQWQGVAQLNVARMYTNAVLLPDGTTLVVGGTSTDNASGNFVKDGELLSDGLWTRTKAMASGRGYHSTAVLLPNGMVLSAGGEGRSVDYQLYKPPYLFRGGRPVITSSVTGGANPNIIVVGDAAPTYELTYTAGPGRHAQRVVLMRPCSVTHHSDFEQRHVALQQVAAPDNTVRFKAPPHNRYTPLGYYMLFVVDNDGVPSEAIWVQLD